MTAPHPLLPGLRGAFGVSDSRVRFDQLRPGQAIRHASEVWVIVTLRPDRMYVRSEESPLRYEWIEDCAADETFYVEVGF